MSDERQLKDVEIFATGTWNASKGGKLVVTEADLDALVASFSTINQIGGFKPVLKLGHTETVKWFGNDKGAPSLGFVANVRRLGKKVVADFVNVAPLLFDLVQAGRYTQVSIEMFRKAKFAGQEFKNVLTAVAILGAEAPAVKGLRDLREALLQEVCFPEQLEVVEQCVELTQSQDEGSQMADKSYDQDQVDALVTAAVANASKDLIAGFDAEKQALTAERDALNAQTAALTERADAAEAELTKLSEASAEAELVTLVNGAISEGRWLPKDKDKLLAMGRNMGRVAEFGDGNGGAAFKDFLATLPKVVALSQELGTGDTANPDQDEGAREAADVTIERRMTALMAEGKAPNASEAYRMALAEAPEDLKQRLTRGE